MVGMNEELLTDIGLNQGQAKAYLTLIKSGELTVPDLVEKIGESRTNTYMILEKLEELGLVTKQARPRKTTYRANNPTALEKLTESRRKTLMEAENRVKASLPQMLSFFYTFSEEPGVRMFQGKDDLIKIYEDHLRTRQDLYFVRSPQDVPFFGDPFFEKYKQKRVQLGIKTHAFTPDVPDSRANAKHDAENNMVRTWLPTDSYQEPVEIDVYGNKVAFISFGEEVVGMIIESPQIAKAMRALLQILSRVQDNSK
jgi:sugar-specific transcriptional regulator TrmB